MAPSEESTRSIEEVIRARCKDGLWDDVVRRAALKPTDFRPKPADLSLEKSDKGLGDEYAAAFETNARSSEEMPRTPLSSVSSRLPLRAGARLQGSGRGGQGARGGARTARQARLAPRPALLLPLRAAPREARGDHPHRGAAAVSLEEAAASKSSPRPLPDPPPLQAPAVSLEEKVPTALAASSTLAPEEVYGRKRSDKALADRAELSQGERKALRSKKKRVHKRRTAESAEQRTLRAEAQPGGAAARRQEADRVGEQLAEAKRRGTITSGPLSSGKQRGRSSSKAFFSSMQAASQAPGGLAGSKRQRVADARKAAQGAGAADGASFKL